MTLVTRMAIHFSERQDKLGARVLSADHVAHAASAIMKLLDSSIK
jgi:hypothetical protein